MKTAVDDGCRRSRSGQRDSTKPGSKYNNERLQGRACLHRFEQEYSTTLAVPPLPLRISVRSIILNPKNASNLDRGWGASVLKPASKKNRATTQN